MPHQCLLGNLPGFVHSHGGYPREGDLFWSPADWAWTGGLMDALLPTLYFGQPIVGYRGRFDPERAFALMAKYGVRNAFLFPTALKMMTGIRVRASASICGCAASRAPARRSARRCSRGRRRRSA
jgi:acetyl-CoA synthetase